MTNGSSNPVIKRSTRGVSLVELMAVLAVGTLVLGAAAAGFAQLMKLDRRFSGGRPAWSTHARLVETLRQDAHSSVRFQAKEGGGDNTAPNTWGFFDSTGRETRYTFAADGRCERVVLVDLAGVGLTDTENTYRLPPGATWMAEPADAGVGQLVRLTLTLPGRPEQPARRQTIVVALGRDAAIAGEVQP